MRSGLSIKKSFPSKVLKTEASFELLNYYFLRLFESFQAFFNLKKYFWKKWCETHGYSQPQLLFASSQTFTNHGTQLSKYKSKYTIIQVQIQVHNYPSTNREDFWKTLFQTKWISSIKYDGFHFGVTAKLLKHIKTNH